MSWLHRIRRRRRRTVVGPYAGALWVADRQIRIRRTLADLADERVERVRRESS